MKSLFSIICLSAFTAFQTNAAKVKLYVKENTTKCSNNTCYLVKFAPKEKWQVLNSSIAGFNYEEGNQYELWVDKKTVNKKTNYKLISVVSSKQISEKKDPNFTYVKIHEWHLIELNNKTANTSNITLRFDSIKPQVLIKGDCNNFFGTYTLQGNNLSLGPIAGTRKSCSETIDQSFIDKISTNTITYAISKNTLTLFDKGVKIAVFQKDNYSNIIQYLSKYTWKMHILNGETLTGNTPTINFNATDTTVNGFSGCNNYSGKVSFTTNTITFDKVISTMRGCLDDNMIEMERAMHQIFGDKQLTVEVVDQTLNIYKNNQLITTFIRDLKKVRATLK